MAYRLVGADNGADKVEWLGSSTATASTLLASHERDDERTDRDEAAEWLIDYLEANDGASIAGAAIKAAAAVGIAKTTLTRARKRAGGVSVKAGCRHGMLSGDQPDEFVKGRLSCPLCAMEATS